MPRHSGERLEIDLFKRDFVLRVVQEVRDQAALVVVLAC